MRLPRRQHRAPHHLLPQPPFLLNQDSRRFYCPSHYGASPLIEFSSGRLDRLVYPDGYEFVYLLTKSRYNTPTKPSLDNWLNPNLRPPVARKRAQSQMPQQSKQQAYSPPASKPQRPLSLVDPSSCRQRLLKISQGIHKSISNLRAKKLQNKSQKAEDSSQSSTQHDASMSLMNQTQTLSEKDRNKRIAQALESVNSFNFFKKHRPKPKPARAQSLKKALLSFNPSPPLEPQPAKMLFRCPSDILKESFQRGRSLSAIVKANCLQALYL